MAAALLEFKSTRKMGGSVFCKKYEDELVKKMDAAYESFVKRNESKHILNAYRTPAVLGLIMVLSYLVSSILDMIGIDSLSDTAIFGLYIPLLLVGVWLYVRYSGNFREVGAMIDNITATVWENVSGCLAWVCGGMWVWVVVSHGCVGVCGCEWLSCMGVCEWLSCMGVGRPLNVY